MHRTAWAIGVTVLLASSAGAQQGTSPLSSLLALETVMQDVIRNAEPSIACILVSRSDDPKNHDLHDGRLIPESFGSGIVIDPQGLVLTCFHVVREARRVYVRLPGDKGSYAELHAADARSDLAVLRLTDAKALPVKPLKIGDGGAARKGQFVVSLANPFAAGFRDGSASASWGIVSNLRRPAPSPVRSETEQVKTLHQYGTLMQLDARLHLGTSGGAVVNLHGELLGITTALAAITGAETPGGFAVPTDATMRRIIDVLRRGEEVEYGFLGVSFSRTADMPAPLERGEGLAVDTVIPGSPAARAQPVPLRPHDVILSVNDQPIRNQEDLFLQIGGLLAGSPARLQVARFRGGPQQTLNVTLSKYRFDGEVVASKRPEAIGGLRVDYTSILVQGTAGGNRLFHRGGGIPEGVVIREVIEGSPADKARLQPDKVIRKVNNRDVGTPAEFYREMQQARGPVELTLVNLDGSFDRVRLETK